jgi:hypothetical protein
MLSESPSETSGSRSSGSKWACISEEHEGPEPATNPPVQGKTPLEAALAATNTYLMALHTKLQPFVKDLIGCVLTDASEFHYKNKKFNEMRADAAYTPTNCRNVGMVLQALAEVQKSTGFKTLQDELAAETDALQRNWALHFVIPMKEMNFLALKKRYQLSIYWLLLMAAKGFITQVGIEGYNAPVAVMDPLATHTNNVIAPLSVNVHNFLVIYKEAPKLTFVPAPTVTHSLSGVIDQVNGTAQEARG